MFTKVFIATILLVGSTMAVPLAISTGHGYGGNLGYSHQSVISSPAFAVSHAPVATVAHAPLAVAHAPLAVAHAPLAVAHAPLAVAHAAPVVAKVAAAPVAKHVIDYVDAHPAYKFDYAVHDPHTGDVKEQSEVRDGDVVHGSYSLVEPDGTRRVVEYTADDHNGFNAIVHREHNQHPAVIKKVAVAAPVAIKAAPIYASAPIAYKSAPIYSAYHH